MECEYLKVFSGIRYRGVPPFQGDANVHRPVDLLHLGRSAEDKCNSGFDAVT